jgi:hypothetical protein
MKSIIRERPKIGRIAEQDIPTGRAVSVMTPH